MTMLFIVGYRVHGYTDIDNAVFVCIDPSLREVYIASAE